MFGYFGITEYVFPVELEIYDEVLGWIARYDIGYEAILEYSLLGVRFRMVTVKLQTAPELIIKDINYMLKTARENNVKRAKLGIEG